LLHIHRGDPGDEAAEAVPDFADASDLRGRRIHDKIRTLHERHPAAHFAVIGPAGESYAQVRYAAIGLSTENQLRSGDAKMRFCGRGGMGGVMGSKNLLAIVADTPDPKRPPAPPVLKEINGEVARGAGSRFYRDRDKGDGQGGTWAMYGALQPLHAMPERNFNPTGTDASVPLFRDSVEKGPYVVKDESCYRCGIRCHKNVYDRDEAGRAGRFRAKLDYEPLNLLSSNLGIFDPDRALELVDLVDELGMDSISCGGTLGYAMEYNRRHAGEGNAIAGGIGYGDFEAARQAILDIGEGRLPELGQGSLRLAEQVGETGYAMQCKGVEFPAYLPQTNPGYPWALAGGHMSMRTYLLYVFEREADLDYWVQAITGRGIAVLRDDIIGICKFCGMKDDRVAEAIRALTGLEIDKAALRKVVRRTFLRGYRLEKRQGFCAEDYSLPDEAHEDYPQIQLPRFNTREFFAQLRDRVNETFDRMLVEEDLG
ncbi:MAG: aldehyde ferredoxin oxidoreductase C-terminal domain-containing protein, partial [Planctomycetota bacterium]